MVGKQVSSLKIWKITDIIGDTILINWDDISYIRTDGKDTLKIKFKNINGEHYFDHIPQEEMEKITSL